MIRNRLSFPGTTATALVGMTLAALLPAGAAQAADLAFGLTAQGHVQLGYMTPGPADAPLVTDKAGTGFASTDATLSLPLVGPLSLSLGALGIDTNRSTAHETYGTVNADIYGMHISAGVVRPAYDSVALSPLENLAPVEALLPGAVAATRSRMTWGAMYGHYLPYGVSFSSESGGSSDGSGWAVTVNRTPNKDLTTASGALEWSTGDWHVAGAVEASSDGEVGAKLQGMRNFGGFTAGASGYLPSIAGHPAVGEGWLTWHAGHRVAVTGLVQVPTDSRDGGSLAMVGANVGLSSSTSIKASVIGRNHGTAASVGLAFAF